MGTPQPHVVSAPRPADRHRWLRLRACSLCVLAVAVVVSPVDASASDPSLREAKIKAAYIFKFINYVTWPGRAFAGDDAPLVVGAMGDGRVNDYLELIARERTAGSRPLEFVVVDRPEQATGCHILFVPRSVPTETLAAVEPNVRGAPILLVGERPGFAKAAGGIGFIVVDNNVRLQLSLEAAKQRDLQVSSQLAKLSQIID